MNHTAREYFRDWYVKGVKKELTADEFSKRRLAVEELLENEDVSFWIQVIDIYIGDYQSSTMEYANLINIFKRHDELFSLENDYIFRLLLGCTLSEKIEQDYNELTNFIALAVLSRLRFFEDEILSHLKVVAHNQLQKNALNARKQIFTEPLLDIDVSGLNLEISENTNDHDNDDDDLQSFNSILAAKFNELVATVGTIASQNALLNQKNRALAEECEILWWLFTGFSELANKPVKSLSVQEMSIFAAMELSNGTRIYPIVTNSTSFLLAAFDKAGHNPNTQDTIIGIITNINEYRSSVLKTLPEANERLNKYLLLSTAIRNFLTFSQTEWQIIFNQVYKVDLNQSILAISFATQLYEELMIAKLFKALIENGD